MKLSTLSSRKKAKLQVSKLKPNFNCKTFPKGRAAKAEMMKSNLPSKELGKIWKLADTDKDGMLDMEEFALAMHLIKVMYFF